MEIVKRVRGIVRSKYEPQDKEVLWLHYDSEGRIMLDYHDDGIWQHCLDLNAAFFHFGDTPPENTRSLWISDSEMSEYNESNTVVQALFRQIAFLDEKYAELTKLLRYGVIAGDSTSAARPLIVDLEESIKPEEIEDRSGEIEPITDGLLFTVPNISIKLDTSENFQKNYQNLIDGELLFTIDTMKLFIYYKGNFITIGSNGAGGGGLSAEEIMALYFSYLGFTGKDGHKYRLFIDESGKLSSYRNEVTELVLDSSTNANVYVNGRFNINSLYCGGDGDKHSYKACSHNFVELSNGSTKDINLQNIYLLYAPDKDTPFEVLPLRGVIKAGSTYLVRGAQCSIKTNTTVINVDDYDQLWYDSKGELIKFEQKSPIFYLAWGDNGKFFNAQGQLVPVSQLSRVVYNKPILNGYIDSVGINTGSAAEGDKPLKIETGDKWDDLLFVRWYTMDPVSQANKDYTKRNTSTTWTYINLFKEEGISGNNPLYYYSKESKLKYTPRAAKYNKNIFETRTTFNVNKPNMVNITFGRKATDYGDGATRCFNWISVGYYDEYLEYSTDKTHWTRVESMYDSPIIPYNRIRWITTNGTAVTTHKAIVRDLAAGKYYYRVGRLNDDSYKSDIYEFTVRASEDVTSFSFVQTSDQQGFNWLEYQAWKKSALQISNEDIDFTINTGDITQNGNRESEWLDYYDGRKYLRGLEEMFTIGNNDLCGVIEYNLGDGTASTYKINHNNVLYYYCFELDENNLPHFHSGDTEFWMPSIYSFDYGEYHFVSINSEFATNTYKVYTSESGTFMMDAYSQMADWFKKDLQIWKGVTTEPANCGKCLVYMHEMPYTIITHATASENKVRGGSKLNTTRTNGKAYYWSRIFKKYGIRLVFGGHKHTYSMTKPVYDAPENYLNGHSVRQGADLMGDITEKITMKPVVQVTSQSEIVDTDMARFELVSKINAPVYVMCQATGYKLVSNQEIPCRESDNIAWLKKYFPGAPSGDADTANPEQYRPTYIKYTVSPTDIKVDAYHIVNVYSEPTNNKAGSFNINYQAYGLLKKQEIIPGGYTINL